MRARQRAQRHRHCIKLRLHVAEHFLGRTIHLWFPRATARKGAVAVPPAQDIKVDPTLIRRGVVSGRLGIAICNTPL